MNWKLSKKALILKFQMSGSLGPQGPRISFGHHYHLYSFITGANDLRCWRALNHQIYKLKFCISDRHIDGNFERKNLYLSRDKNHRSPDFCTGGLPIRPLRHVCWPRNKLLSHSSFQSKTLMKATCYNSLESNPQVGILVWIYLYVN